jgi:hypothetical protein
MFDHSTLDHGIPSMRLKSSRAMRSFAAFAGILAGSVLAPAAAQAPELAMLDGLQEGGWDVRIRGEDGSNRVCLRSGRELIQIRHRAERCSRIVVEDKASEVTVQYSCPGKGYGRTTIRKETPQLVQINSQGIEKGLPFHFNAEARRAGAC